MAGTPYLTGDVTALGAGNRAFHGPGVGSSPADATLVQSNVLPFHEDDKLTPRAAHRAPRGRGGRSGGQNLYLMASPISDTFVGMRTPGVITIDDTTVHLPVKR